MLRYEYYRIHLHMKSRASQPHVASVAAWTLLWNLTVMVLVLFPSVYFTGADYLMHVSTDQEVAVTAIAFCLTGAYCFAKLSGDDRIADLESQLARATHAQRRRYSLVLQIASLFHSRPLPAHHRTDSPTSPLVSRRNGALAAKGAPAWLGDLQVFVKSGGAKAVAKGSMRAKSVSARARSRGIVPRMVCSRSNLGIDRAQDVEVLLEIVQAGLPTVASGPVALG
jgi:hypothetical protein